MKEKRISLISWALMLAILLSACQGNIINGPATGPEEGNTTVHNQSQNPTNTTDSTVEYTQPSYPPVTEKGYGLKPLCYPRDAVKTLSDRMISLGSFRARAAAETSYQGNRHYTGTNLVISPYFSATVDGLELPVYATPVYVYTNSHGALHSFASVDVSFGDHESISLRVQIMDSLSVQSAQLFSHDLAKLELAGSNLELTVNCHGVYTVVFNNDQDCAITFFVRNYEDEETKIAEYRTQYGEENVIVVEPGIHEIDHLLMLDNNMVLYLKAGAILLPKHTIDIMSDEAAQKEEEFGAQLSNGLGLNRYPVISGYNCNNLTIAGRGTVDMTQLDWHERRGIVFTMCNEVKMDGVIVINPCEWAFITYRCENVTVTQSAVFGYRTNSDAFAICNSIDATITDCFARTGDDMFEVKTLGGASDAFSRNITFSRCQAWGSKARCFGVIGEIERDVENVVFEDGIVIFRDAIWDNNRIGSLVVLRECGTGNVNNVAFRNIFIHHDSGRPIQVGVYTSGLTGGTMDNIIFEDVTYNANMNGQVRKHHGSDFRIVLKNIVAGTTKLTNRNVEQFIYADASGMLIVEQS